MSLNEQATDTKSHTPVKSLLQEIQRYRHLQIPMVDTFYVFVAEKDYLALPAISISIAGSAEPGCGCIDDAEFLLAISAGARFGILTDRKRPKKVEK